jgi:Tol biopolymer transport system component
VFVIDPDFGNNKQLTHLCGGVDCPSWPDGKRIAYVEPAGEDREVFVIDPDGGNKKQLTHLGGGVDFPTWPDGKRIAFLHGFHILYVMNADGSELRELLKVDVGQRPAWKPR